MFTMIALYKFPIEILILCFILCWQDEILEGKVDLSFNFSYLLYI